MGAGSPVVREADGWLRERIRVAVLDLNQHFMRYLGLLAFRTKS